VDKTLYKYYQCKTKKGAFCRHKTFWKGISHTVVRTTSETNHKRRKQMLQPAKTSVASTSMLRNLTANHLPEGFYPKDMDILCGRGEKCIKHPGTRRFHRIIKDNLENYMNASSRFEKSIVISSIVTSVQECGTRFIKFNRNAQRFVVLSEDQAREKAGHFIRDLVAKTIKQKEKSGVGLRKRGALLDGKANKCAAMNNAKRCSESKESLSVDNGDPLTASRLPVDSTTSDSKKAEKFALDTTHNCIEPLFIPNITVPLNDVGLFQQSGMEPLPLHYETNSSGLSHNELEVLCEAFLPNSGRINDK